MHTKAKWTEEQIERRVERMFDKLDARLLAGEISQATYDELASAIAEWADMAVRGEVRP